MKPPDSNSSGPSTWPTAASKPSSPCGPTSSAYLLGSWFNRGFLTLRSIDWQTPAEILEKLIEHEAVHEIRGWDDLRRRLADDRRCFAFLHPSLPREPLIFVEIALTRGLTTRIADVLDTPEPRAEAMATDADTATFYSITNCQPGLRAIPLGDILLKQVIERLRDGVPRLHQFATLSPVPGLRRWAGTNASTSTGPTPPCTTSPPPISSPPNVMVSRSTRSPGSTSATGPDSNASTRAATPHRRVSGNRSVCSSTISTTSTRSPTTTRPTSWTGAWPTLPTSPHLPPDPRQGGRHDHDDGSIRSSVRVSRTRVTQRRHPKRWNHASSTGP